MAVVCSKLITTDASTYALYERLWNGRHLSLRVSPSMQLDRESPLGYRSSWISSNALERLVTSQCDGSSSRTTALTRVKRDDEVPPTFHQASTQLVRANGLGIADGRYTPAR